MSGKTPEEEAGYVRFTVVLPEDVVQQIDVLKAYAKLSNRNRVIEDAIGLLNETVSSVAFGAAQAFKDADITDPKKLIEIIDKPVGTKGDVIAIDIAHNVLNYATINLSKYWASLTTTIATKLNQNR